MVPSPSTLRSLALTSMSFWPLTKSRPTPVMSMLKRYVPVVGTSSVPSQRTDFACGTGSEYSPSWPVPKSMVGSFRTASGSPVKSGVE